MLTCFDNIRQTNEKIDDCVKVYKDKLTDLEKGIKEIYKDQSVLFYYKYTFI